MYAIVIENKYLFTRFDAVWSNTSLLLYSILFRFMYSIGCLIFQYLLPGKITFTFTKDTNSYKWFYKCA